MKSHYKNMASLLGKYILLVSITLVCSSSAIAENALSIPGITTELDAGKTSDQIPRPYNLNSKWWTYFQVEQPLLSERINSFKTSLDETVSKLPIEDQGIIRESLASIQNSLKLLQIVKQSDPDSISSSKKVFNGSYSVPELVELLKTVSITESKFNLQKSEIQSDRNESSLIEKTIDALLVKHKKLGDESQSKVMLGIEIIANRLTLVISEQDNVFTSNQLSVYETELKNLKEEVAYASNNLNATEEDLDNINSSITASDEVLAASQDKVFKTQSEFINLLGIESSNRENKYLHNQSLVTAKVKHALEQVANQSLVLQKTLSESLLKLPITQLNAPNVNRKFIDALNNNISEWRNATFAERDRNVELIQSVDFSEDDGIAELSKKRFSEIQKSIVNLSILENDIKNFEYINNIYNKRVSKTGGLKEKLKFGGSLAFGDVIGKTKDIFNKSLFKISDVPVTFFDLLQALLIVLFSILISRIVRKILNKFGKDEHNVVPPIFYNLGRIFHYIIILIGLIIALSAIGIGLTNLAIVAGALSVGIGFGLQSIVQNFVSGIIVLFERKIEIGDFVKLDSGQHGNVKDINVRSTVITTPDNLDIIIPNSELVSAQVTNYTMNEQMFRIHIPFGVAYGSDKDMVVKAALEAARHVPVTYDDGAQRRAHCWLVDLADSSINFELVVWVNPIFAKNNKVAPGSWKSLYLWELETALNKYDINIPFPQQDLHIKSSLDINTENLLQAD